MQQSPEDLRHQIQQLEKRIEQLTTSHQEEKYSYNQRIYELSNKIQESENARSSLVQELQYTQSVCRSLKADNSSLRQRLNEAKYQLSAAELEIMKLQNRLKVIESSDDTLNINSLPDEVILEIFGYLTQNQLGQIARVCKRWNELTRSPVLWKKVNVRFSPSHRPPTTVTKSLIKRLPPCLTSIRLNLAYSREQLDFVEFCLTLQEKCLHLEVLIFICSTLSCSLSAVIDLCTQFLQNVKKLVFCRCIFLDSHSAGEKGGISKIETLYVINCVFYPLHKPPFSRMPCLKRLQLFASDIGDYFFEGDPTFLNQLQVLSVGYTFITSRIFSLLQNYGFNLQELCLCSVRLQDHDLNISHSAFPQLKTICLRDCYDVTCEGVVSLLQSCPSLQDVYVDKDLAESFEVHPFVVASRCKSGIVKAIDCNHSKELDRYCGDCTFIKFFT